MKVRTFILIFLSLFILGISPLFSDLAQAQTSQSFSQSLTIGDSGAEVASLQSFLISNGFLPISGPTGFFGDMTSAAVAKWQASIGLPDTGYFGVLSRAAIESGATTTPSTTSANVSSTPISAPAVSTVPTTSALPIASASATAITIYPQNLSVGATGSDVVDLQSFLIGHGFLSVASPTGFFGDMTSAAVAKWQASIGLPDTGYFGVLSRADLENIVDKSTSSVATGSVASEPSTSVVSPSPIAVPTPESVPTSTHTAVSVPADDFGGGGGGSPAPQYVAPVAPVTPTTPATTTPSSSITMAASSSPMDTTPPAAFITSPITSSTVASNNNISVAVTASDNIGVIKVQFYIDGVLIASSTNAPYIFPVNIKILPSGTHTLTAKAYDAAGNTGTTPNTTIIVVPPAPTTPLGLTVTNNTSSSISLSWATSTELGGSIAGYQLYRGSTQVATATVNFFTNTGLTASTTYTYSVDSYDAGGVISATSTSVATTTLPLPPPVLNYNFGLSLGESPVYLSSSSLNQELNTMVSLGVGWIRFDMQWEHVQPNNSSTYNWSLIDPVVAAAAAHHIKILAILDFTPAWAASSSCVAGNSHCAPADPNAFATFAAAAVKRYSSQGVSDWEIWNEPNNVGFWGPVSNCDAYTALLKATYPAIKAADPNATVITAGLSPAATDGLNMSPPDFLSCIYADGGKNYFDAVGDHPYTFPSFPSNDGGGAWNQMALGSSSLRGIMVANGDSSKKIWATEYGTPTNGPDPAWYVSEAQQAAMMTDAINLYSTYSWAGPFFWYTYQDGGTSTSTNENFFGLLRADGSTKPAYQTFQNLIASTTTL